MPADASSADASPAEPVTIETARAMLRAEDPRFFEAIRTFTDAEALQPLAAEWKTLETDWSRGQKLAYFEQPLDVPGHQTVVKQLFKQAEDDDDWPVLAACLVAFDRLVRYERTTEGWPRHHSAQRFGVWLRLLRDHLPTRVRRRTTAPRQGLLDAQFVSEAWGSRWHPWTPRPGTLFMHRTRQYLRRRAWRNFRRLGQTDPDGYLNAVPDVLRLYTDADLTHGEDALECWGLMHICFGESDRLGKTTGHFRLRGESLDDLQPAPAFSQAWKTDRGGDALFLCVSKSRSTLVRRWATQALDDFGHAVPPNDLADFGQSRDADVAQWALARLIETDSLDRLLPESWEDLIIAANPAILESVCRLARKYVDAQWFSIQNIVHVVTEPATSVSRLGLHWLDTQTADPAADRLAFQQLARSECEATGSDVADWVLAHVGTAEHYDRDLCLALLGSPNRAIRREAWDWLREDTCPGRDDAELWARVVALPHAELRGPLLRELDRRARLSKTRLSKKRVQIDSRVDLTPTAKPVPLSPASLAPLWTAALLDPTTGRRDRQAVLRQVRDALSRDPSQADTLLPVLRAGVRSGRRPDRAAALAAVVAWVAANPERLPQVEALLPELRFDAVADAPHAAAAEGANR